MLNPTSLSTAGILGPELVLGAGPSRWRIWSTWAALTSTGWLALVLGNGGTQAGLSCWIWLALWAPAAGALASAFRPTWQALLPALIWGGGLLQSETCAATDGMAGSCAVMSLYFAGWALPGRGVAAAAFWLLLGGTLSALPSAGGIWFAPPGAAWLLITLDLSPVVWVTELAGVDWMRHFSVYESAGAGDLAPDQRQAWSGVNGPALVVVCAWVARLLQQLRLRREI